MKTESSKADIAVAAIALAVATACTPAGPTPGRTADAIYAGGDIVTVNDAQPTAEALAVKNGKILAVGAKADIEKAHKGATTQAVDLGGKTLLPGLLDAHSHYINALSVARQVKLYAPPAGPGKDVDSIVAEIGRFVAENKVPKGEMITGYGYDDTVMPNGRLLDRDDLDKAFPDNPVRIDHVSMHGAVLNSLALKQFGFDARTKTPPGGIIVRKPGTNEPRGLIMETAFLPVFEKTPPLTPAQEIEGTKAAHLMYAEAGITTAHEGATHLAQLQTIKRAADAGANLIDVVAYPFITDVDKVLVEFPVSGWGQYDRHFKIGGVKITIDGSPQGRTALFTTPYRTGGPGGEKNWRGELTFPQDVVNQAVKKVYDLGVPLNLHANGDGAIDAFLRAHEFAAAGDLTRDRQRDDDPRAVHPQGPDPEVRRVQDPPLLLHAAHLLLRRGSHRQPRPGAGHVHQPDAGRDRRRPAPDQPHRRVVAPLDQMFMLWSAVNRISRAGAEIGPDQRVTPFEGLKAMTIWVAEQYGEQAQKGTLEAGKLADMVLLSSNPLKVDRMAIKDIQVLETFKEGKSIYRKQ